MTALVRRSGSPAGSGCGSTPTCLRAGWRTHISLITGQTGSGKTQGAKAILARLREAGITPLVIDFKGDWSAPDAFGVDWARDLDLPVYAPKAGHLQLPFNPLTRPSTSLGRQTLKTMLMT